MKKPLFLAAAAALVLPNCAGLPGESPEHMEKRMDRQDSMIDRRMKKREIRTRESDARYHQWWDTVMGRSDGM